MIRDYLLIFAFIAIIFFAALGVQEPALPYDETEGFGFCSTNDC